MRITSNRQGCKVIGLSMLVGVLLLGQSSSVASVVPGSPTSVVAVSGNTQLAVTWTAPATTGGSAITDYLVEYSSNGGSTWTTFTDPVSTATSCIVTGLTNGTAYVIQVSAQNAVGLSLPSANSAPATPTNISVLAALPDLSVLVNAPPHSINVDALYDNPDVTGTVVMFTTNQSEPNNLIYIELFDQAGPSRTRTTPLTAANFLAYANAGEYNNTFIHRSVPGFVVQGGGFTVTSAQPGISIGNVTQRDPVVNEPKPADASAANNVRGTIAMAKLGSDPNSATNQWFFNLADNSANLDAQNGGFTVFGRVLGNGMAAVDAIAQVPRFGYASPFDTIPLRNVPGANPSTNPSFTNPAVDTTTLADDQFVKFLTIAPVGELVYSVTSSAPALVSPSFDSAGKLVLTYGAVVGTATVTVRASSVFNADDFVDDSFSVNVTVAAPVVSSAATASGKIGTAFSYQITATGGATSYSATGLPAGLTVNTATGLISGTPSTAGTFTSSISASNSAGTGSASLTIAIAKGTPTITVAPTASPIIYGQTLASSTLSGGSASVAGTFAWTTPSTAPAAGTSSYSVTFTPNDTANYNTVTRSVSVTVNKATPTIIVAPTGTAMTYGQTLASSTLSGGSASVAGNFSWTTPSTAPAAGTSSYSVTFTPNDTANYNTVTRSVSVTVNKATPTIIVAPTGSAMTYGQTLASSTLSGGSASVAGNFSWTTPSTAPAVGTTVQNVTFTPTDTANYNTVTRSVSVVVAKKALTGSFTASSKSYDGNNSATVVTRMVNGIVGSDNVYQTGGAATYNSAAVANNKVVTLVGATLAGAAAGNYTLSSVSTTTANITPKVLTIIGAVATTRVYNGLMAVAVGGGSLSGVVGADAVTLGGTPAGTMATATAGSAKSVAVTGYIISGASAASYRLLQPTGLTVNITKANTTISVVPTAQAINYGQTLASSSLGGGSATVAGSFNWTTPSTIPSVGTSSQGVTFTPTDAANYNTATTSVNVMVNSTITSNLSAVTIPLGANYSYQITGSGSPTSFQVTGLPKGLSVKLTSGQISGAPSQTGTFPVILRSLSGKAIIATATKVFTVVQVPTFTYVAKINATKGKAFNVAPKIAGYPAPSFSIISGSLPPGLSLNASTAAITGKPTTVGTYPFTVRGSNSAGNTDRSVTILVK